MTNKEKRETLIASLNILNEMPFVGLEVAQNIATAHRVIASAIGLIEVDEPEED